MSLIADNETKIDLLGREIFAKRIVKSLIDSFASQNDNLVVGVSGRWGAGKSTLLSFIRNNVVDACSVSKIDFSILEFNSWASTGNENLENNFLEKIVNSLLKYSWKSIDSETTEKLSQYLIYLRQIKFSKYIQLSNNSILNEICIGKREIPSLEEVKELASNLLLKNNLKLFILIDDIDRLIPSEITNLFKILKVSLNLSNTFFIIAYDKDIVINALSTEFNFNGESYLEKIIQVDFAVPPILQKQIEYIFFDKLYAFFERLGIQFDNIDLKSIWKLHGLNEYFKSIRDLNRYFNNLVFSVPNIGSDVNLQDFLIIEAIRTFDNSSYNRLYDEVILIDRKKIWEKITIEESLKSYENETTKSLLNVLFVRDYSSAANLLGKRLKDRDFFERYFSLSIPVTDVTEYNIQSFFAPGSNKEAILTEIYNSGKMENFLTRISDSSLEISIKSSDLEIFFSFMKFWDNRSAPIDIRFSKLIITSYFNMVNFCEDVFLGAEKAVSQLFLEPNTTSRVRFIFNNSIHHNHFNTLNNYVFNQIKHKKEDLFKNFLIYIDKQRGSFVMRVLAGEGNWIDSMFLYSLATFKKELYFEELEKYIGRPSFISFLVDNFIMIDTQTGYAGNLSLDSLNKFLPKEYLKIIINEIRNISKDSMADLQYQKIIFFADNVYKRNANE